MRVSFLLSFLLVHGGLLLAASGQSLSGIVLDAKGTAVSHAQLTLRCNGSLTAQTTTSETGSYAFSDLRPCEYEINAQAGVASVRQKIQIDGSQPHLVQNLTLGSETHPPKPTFAASGIRGLIDPGGYSAPANAAAASNLLTGMAEANRTKSASCHPGPPLDSLAADYAKSPGNTDVAIHYAQGLLTAQQFAEAGRVLNSPAAQGRGEQVRRLRAQADEGLGQFADSAREYALINEQQPAAENLFAQGYEEILDGRPQVAALTFRAGLRSFPGNAALLLGLGTTEFLAGHGKQAVILFLAAAESEPSDPRPYPFLAAAWSVSAGDEARVAEALHRHLTLVPGDAAGHLALASVLLHQATTPESNAEAAAELRHSLQLDPSLVEAHYQLAMLLTRDEAHEGAVRELQLVVALDPERREAHYRLAQELRKMGNTQAAELEMARFQQARAQESTATTDVRRYLSVVGHQEACVTR